MTWTQLIAREIKISVGNNKIRKEIKKEIKEKEKE